jgi:23S rRNA (uridine2552-2'-O)-methyltransferase
VAQTKSSKAWMREHVSDVYVKRARKEGYRSRAAYKLMEIDLKDKLLTRGMTALDLGAAPGGWSQVAAEKLGASGRVIAIDLLPMQTIANVTFLQGDFSQDAVREQLATLIPAGVDLVLSDLSPNISGVAASDQAQTYALAETALEFAGEHLNGGGAFLVKVFQGADFMGFRRTMAGWFETVVVRKPGASRERSAEVYLLGRRRKVS